MRIYVASSWRNAEQSAVVSGLRDLGHDVYDFKNPVAGNAGFNWKEITSAPKPWPGSLLVDVLDHIVARCGFALDKAALDWCDACVMVLECGKSAHLELGYCTGAGKLCHILLPSTDIEPELMYLLVGRENIHTTLGDLLAAFAL